MMCHSSNTPGHRRGAIMPAWPHDAGRTMNTTQLTASASEATGRGSDYAELLGRVRRAGLLARRPGYDALRVATNGVLLAVGWALFVVIGASWWQLLTAAYLAVMFTQTGFVGHDAGHHQIAGSRRANQLLGLLHGNLRLGLAVGWGGDKHHRHH